MAPRSGHHRSHDVLRLLDNRRVARIIARLLIAAAALALARAATGAHGESGPVMTIVLAVTAVAFVLWQRLAPTRDVRALMEIALYAGAVLVIAVAAFTGRDDSPYLLFLIWLVPWAFLAWSRLRASVYVAALVVACGSLFASDHHGGGLAAMRADLVTLLVAVGGLAGVGVVIRLVVDRLADSQEAARRAARSQTVVARLARRALEEIAEDGPFAREALDVLREVLGADAAEALPGRATPAPPEAFDMPIEAAMGPATLRVTRAGRPLDGEERSLVAAIADVLDVAARRTALERARRERAGHDELTGLPGRDLFTERLTAASAGGAVLVVDLDEFVLLNETVGSDTGDVLLRMVAARLRDVAGPDATIARLGADEFGLFEAGSGSETAAVALAERVRRGLRRAFDLGEARHHVTASIGIAICAGACEPRNALRDAHLAQRRAREQGRGRYQLFHSGLRRGLERRRALEQDLRRALEAREFRLVYQPVVNLETGRICAAEALLRWQHPERGLIAPGEFIEVAEQAELIVPLGAWVLREALRQLKAWEHSLSAASDFRVSVNVSGRQLADGRFVDLLRGLLTKYEIDPRRVACELTETALADESAQVEAAVQGIRALGVSLALDDFGTGYASLQYVRRFPFTALKLDRSFVAGLGDDPHDTALAAAAISMGEALDLTVVAEGVETAKQARRLRSMGCRLAQGYAFARPMEPASLRELLRHPVDLRPRQLDVDARPGARRALQRPAAA